MTKKQGYYENLSDASQRTLNYQGGKMTEEEIKQFESMEFFNLCLKSREWDDKAKVKDMKTPKFVEFKEITNIH